MLSNGYFQKANNLCFELYPEGMHKFYELLFLSTGDKERTCMMSVGLSNQIGSLSQFQPECW